MSADAPELVQPPAAEWPMRRCESCAHWGQFFRQAPGDTPGEPLAPTSWGRCSRPLDTAQIAAPFPPDWQDNDRIHTHRTFGCVAWEPEDR